MQDDAFEWDDAKSDRNGVKHRMRFDDARSVFNDQGVVEEPDTTMDYGEDRFRAVGFVNGVMIAVFYAWRGDRCRIISARVATRSEERAYVEQNN
jgi:uncharacterized protein